MRKCIEHGNKRGSFCGICRRALEISEEEKISSFPISVSEPCPKCGYKFNRSEKKMVDYCPGCGVWLKWDD
jgi:uncharacterized CHY-type Zn-finger protein